MARRSNVPKFGDWENEGNVPYTVYFDKARQNRGTEKMPHGDPIDQAHALSSGSARPQEPVYPKEQERRGAGMVRPNKPGPEPPSAAANDQRQGRGRSTGAGNRAEVEVQRNWDASRSNHEQRYVKEDGGQRRAGGEPRSQGEAAAGQGRARRRVGVGSEHGGEGSTLQRNQQARAGAGGNVGSSHPSEGKNLYQGSTGHGFAPLTPGRTRPKPVSYTSDDLDYGSAVPKFGAWNEGNPDSGENYTEKFNKVLKERHNGAVVAPSPAGYHRQPGTESPTKKCGCFPWSKN